MTQAQPSGNTCLISVHIRHIRRTVRPMAQAVERRTPGTVPPVIRGARVRDASALDLLQPPDGDGLRSGRRPQPVEVSECNKEFPVNIYGKNIVRPEHATAEVLP